MSRLNREQLQDKIKSNVIPDGNGCWIWQKSFGSHGYGNIATGGGRNETVHRVAYEVFNGEIPKGSLVLHSCDNRKCCNPEHLRSGSHKENVIDMVHRSNIKRKLTFKEAEEIKNSSLPQRKLATMYGVSQRLIYSIKRGTAWQHVTQQKALNE